MVRRGAAMVRWLLWRDWFWVVLCCVLRGVLLPVVICFCGGHFVFVCVCIYYCGVFRVTLSHDIMI